jgi:hypothetical protein
VRGLIYDWSDLNKPVPQDAALLGLATAKGAGNVAARLLPLINADERRSKQIRLRGAMKKKSH